MQLLLSGHRLSSRITDLQWKSHLWRPALGHGSLSRRAAAWSGTIRVPPSNDV